MTVMRKQELIHLHGLLSEVSAYCETVDGEAFEMPAYEALQTTPTSIHQSKTDHKEAVFALSDALTRRLEADVEGSPPAAAD